MTTIIHTSSNGFEIRICNYSQIENILNNSYSPSIVMITAWKIDESDIKKWQKYTALLITKRVSVIICIGKHSEELHDIIDDIYINNECMNDICEGDIITTFHTDEKFEDIINYSLNGFTGLRNGRNILAILDDQVSHDMEIKSLLLAV